LARSSLKPNFPPLDTSIQPETRGCMAHTFNRSDRQGCRRSRQTHQHHVRVHFPQLKTITGCGVNSEYYLFGDADINTWPLWKPHIRPIFMPETVTTFLHDLGGEDPSRVGDKFYFIIRTWAPRMCSCLCQDSAKKMSKLPPSLTERLRPTILVGG
jgi:hypothetical protein